MASLSDGVFSVALTLLVLPVTTVRVRDGNVLADVLALGPQLFAFVLSFAVIGRYWVAHHDDVSLMSGATRRLLVANLVFLFFVVLLPFPTALIGEDGGRTATVLYAVSIIATALASLALWRTAGAEGLLTGVVARVEARRKEWDTVPLVGAFAVSIPVAILVSPTWAQATWALSVPLGIVAGRWRDRRPRGG